MSDPILSIQNLVKHFGGLYATDNLQMEITKGETHAVIGPNGAGKTTLIDQIAGGKPVPRLVKGLAAVAQALEGDVSAEGVEKAHQAEVLRNLGAQMAQGWHFSKPLRLEAFLAYFHESRKKRKDPER